MSIAITQDTTNHLTGMNLISEQMEQVRSPMQAQVESGGGGGIPNYGWKPRPL